jgi:murein DD-endopeptidase MepM/ murein hydrolase activator NlpD
MLRRLVFVFTAFLILVIGDYFITSMAKAFSSPSFFSLPGISTPYSGSGLTSVDFSVFTKNGKGWSYITQGYGVTPYSYLYVGHWHDGIDIAANYGASVYSPTDGIVIATGDQDNYCPRRGFGRYVAVEDDINHLVLWFAHLNVISVVPGQTIKKGALLATIGNSGLETGPHLHFSIFQSGGFNMNSKNGCGPGPNGRDLNPLSYLGTVYQ